MGDKPDTSSILSEYDFLSNNAQYQNIIQSVFPTIFSFHVKLRFVSNDDSDLNISLVEVFDISGTKIPNLTLHTTDPNDIANKTIDDSFDTYGYGNDIQIKIPGIKDNIGYIKVYNVSSDLDDENNTLRKTLKEKGLSLIHI